MEEIPSLSNGPSLASWSGNTSGSESPSMRRPRTGRWVPTVGRTMRFGSPGQRTLGGEFEFSKGRLTSFSFEEVGREFAQKYARGTAGKNRTGSLVIGLHPRLKNVAYTEEKERGAVQLTVGGNTYSGGNNASDFRGALCLPGAEI